MENVTPAVPPDPMAAPSPVTPGVPPGPVGPSGPISQGGPISPAWFAPSGPGPFGSGPSFGSGEEPWVAVVRESLLAVAVAVAVTALGGPLGLLWRVLVPRVELVKTTVGWYPVQEEPEGYIAGDGWFAALGAATGLLLAVAAWLLLRRMRGPAVLAALAIGSLAGAILAAWLGHRIGLPAYRRQLHDAAPGVRLYRLAEIRTGGVLLVQAVVATMVYTLLAAFHHDPSLRSRPPTDPYDPDHAGHGGTAPGYGGVAAPGYGGGLSSGSWGPPDRPAAPAPPEPGTAGPPPDAGANALPATG